jgi:hypothetical protein
LKIINALLARAAVPNLGERRPSRLVATAAQDSLKHPRATHTSLVTASDCRSLSCKLTGLLSAKFFILPLARIGAAG